MLSFYYTYFSISDMQFFINSAELCGDNKRKGIERMPKIVMINYIEVL